MNLKRPTSEYHPRTTRKGILLYSALLLPSVFGIQSPSTEFHAILPRPKPESAGSSPLLRIDSSLVLIPVRATTAVGTPVLNLTRDDFRLFEDGVEQTVTEFVREEKPVSVVIVFDASGSMKNKMLRSYKAAAALLRSANPEDEFCLLTLNDRPRVTVPFTTDLDLISADIARRKASGRTSLLDAVYLAIAETKHAHNPRRGIVVISDGGENWSRHSTRAIKQLLTESEAQLFAMGIYDVNYSSKRFSEERDGPRLLDDLSRQTGGREYAVDNNDDLATAGERIGTALRSEYLLGYYPVNKTRDGKYRCVTLRINEPPTTVQPKIHLYYRQGYYAISE